MSFTSSFASNRFPSHVCMLRRPVLAKFRLCNLASPVSSANFGDIDTDQEDAQNKLSPLQLIAANPRGSVNTAAVNRLKKAELREELNLRGLPEEGTREVLRKRLNQAIKSEQSIPAAAGVGVETPARPQAQTQVHQQLPADTHIQAAASPVSSPANTALEPSQRVTAPMPNASRFMQDAAASRRNVLDFQDTGQAQQSSTQAARQSLPSSNLASPIAGSSNDTSGSTVSTQAAAAAPEGAHSGSSSRAGQSPAAPELSVTWLGTSSGSPSLRRNVSCIALTLGQSTYLVDCGEGTSRQILRANIHPACIKGVFISHLHGDHCFGLPGLVELVSEAHEAAKSPSGMRTLQVFGPPGIQQLVQGALAVSMPGLHTKLVVTDYTVDPAQAKAETAVDPTGLIAFARQAPDAQSRPDLQQPPRGRSRSHSRQQQSLQVHNVPVIPGLVWTIRAEEGLVVTAAQLQHRLPCWGYVFQEVASPRQPGRKVVLLGDTCDSEAIVGPGMGADLVSHEATFSAGMEKKAYVAQHSTAPMAGAFARKIRAKALVLTHFSNRYSNKGEMQGEHLRSESEGDRQDVLQWLTNQAKQAYGSDRVWAADDFYTFQVRRGPTRAVAGYAHAQTPGNTARRAKTN
ncbi:TPA: hypothetical protein ACH3X1_003776 [Trebouxia sp. C0004]